MPWFTTSGNAPEHVIRSETKYARNFKSLPFNCRIDKAQREKLISKLEKVLDANGFKKAIDSKCGGIELLSYAEKGFCDAEASMLNFGDDKNEQSLNACTSLYFNEPCSLSVAIGGKDMLVIRSLLSGLAISETQSIALEAEELFDRDFEFAYSDNIGYLSPYIHNCGSGERFSVVLFLPALKESDEIEDIRALASHNNSCLTPFVNSTDNCGDMYILSHSPTAFCNHLRDAELFCALTNMIIEKEKLAESIILREKRKIISESARRSLGTMLYASKISERELLEHIGNMRFCLSTHTEIAGSPNVTILNLNRVLAECLSFSVLSSHPDCSSLEELDEKRAYLTQRILSDNTDKA